MSTQTNLAAATIGGSMPPYISVNILKDDLYSTVAIDVRGHAREVNGVMTYGPGARIVLTMEEFKSFVQELTARSYANGLL